MNLPERRLALCAETVQVEYSLLNGSQIFMCRYLSQFAEDMNA